MKQNELPEELGLAPHGWRLRRWAVVLGGVVLAAGIAIGVGGKVLRLSAPALDLTAKPAPRDGTFQATPAQLASFRIKPASTLMFRSERVTDGKIAINLNKTTPVFSPFSGRVTKVMANLGDHVKQGQPLLAVEATEFAQGQNDLIGATAAVNTARAQLKQAEITEARKRALYEAKAGALQDWQQSQSELAVAQNNYRSAETARHLVRNRLRILGRTDAEISALENAERINPTAFVVAPISGTVTDRQVGLGQYIQAGASTPVYTIGDLSTLWLIANVRESDAPLMRVGDPVEVRVLALPGQVFGARLTYIAPAVDPNTRRVAVRAEVENTGDALKPEMFASFSIITGGESAAPAVPEGAVVYEGDQARVWVAQGDGKIALRQVRTGRVAGGMVEIVAGLEPEENVVTSGSLFIDRAVKRSLEQATQ